MSQQSRHHALYNTVRWRKLRAAQLRAEPLCAYCERLGRVTAATVADHVEPHRGDEVLFWTGRLQSLCDGCHSSVKQAEEHGGFARGCGVDGLPVDPRHPWRMG